MRRAALICLVVLGASCTQTDPELNKPCNQRTNPKVTLGIGQFAYTEIGDNQGPFIDTDLQNGDFVWLGVSCTDLGPDITLSYGIKANPPRGADLSVTTGDRITLSYNGSTRQDEYFGLQATFKLPASSTLPLGDYTIPEQLVGAPVTVWADVNDACHPDPANPIRGERLTRLEGYDSVTCPGCLDQECHTELGNCGPECHAIQGCLDAYCVNLSALGSADEALCQVYCQSQHPSGKDAHIAVVTCVQDPARGALCPTQTCFDNPVAGGSQSQFCYDVTPCFPYPLDYRHCVNTQIDPQYGPCYQALQACDTASDGSCQAYKACTATCTTWPACQACATQYHDGEILYEQYEACIEDTCLAQGWMIHIF